jgi:uncharacterized RDD family membrane protein YckC
MTVRELSRESGKGILMYRWLGAWIDFVAFWLILIVAEAVLGSELYQRTVWLWVLVALAYFPITELRWGKTLGTKMAGLIVVDDQGRLPNLSQVLKRTLARLVEVNPLGGGLIAAIAVLATKDHQRLGDLWAGTYVVRVEALQALQPTATPSPSIEAPQTPI